MNISTTFSALVFIFSAFTALQATTLTTPFIEQQATFTTVDEAPAFYIMGKDICIDEDVTVPIAVTDFTLITSFQFTISWDQNVMTFDTVSFISPALGNTLLYNDMEADDGILTISWYDTDVAGS